MIESLCAPLLPLVRYIAFIALCIGCLSTNLLRVASSSCCRYNIIPLQLLQQRAAGAPPNRFCLLQTCPTRERGCSDGAFLQPRRQKCAYKFFLCVYFFLFNFFLIAIQRGGIRLSIKRDDETDMLATGNKIRKLSFLLADAIAQVAFALRPLFVADLFFLICRYYVFLFVEHAMTALVHRAATAW